MENTALFRAIWQIADLLRGPYRPPQYERVILPMVVLCRLDSVLSDTKQAVLKAASDPGVQALDYESRQQVLRYAAEQPFYNTSPLNLDQIQRNPDNAYQNIILYLENFSPDVKELIIDGFEFTDEVGKLEKSNILHLILNRFAKLNFHPAHLSNSQMAVLFERLVGKFYELANDTAGDHFTPKDVVSLMVRLLFAGEARKMSLHNSTFTLLDPTCGTGGMLFEAQQYVESLDSSANLQVFGQDYNKRAFAIASAGVLLRGPGKGGSSGSLRFGDTLINDKFKDDKFDYLISHPPFGVNWRRQQYEVRHEHDSGEWGRFGRGLPRINDGSLLFLQHMRSKFKDVRRHHGEEGARLAVVFSGSPLFTGGAGSGESEIRKAFIEGDEIDAIIAIPQNIFYNTSLGTYIWIITNRKISSRRGFIQLIDARDMWVPMRRSMGEKRRRIGGDMDSSVEGMFQNDHIEQIISLYLAYDKADSSRSRIVANDEFGYRQVTIERPLRLRFINDADKISMLADSAPHIFEDARSACAAVPPSTHNDWNEVRRIIGDFLEQRNVRWHAADWMAFRNIFTERDSRAKPVIIRGHYERDPQLRDHELVPLTQNLGSFLKNEVFRWKPDAWCDERKTKIGYEINFDKWFEVKHQFRSVTSISDEFEKFQLESIRHSSELSELLRLLQSKLSDQYCSANTLMQTEARQIFWPMRRLKSLVEEISSGVSVNATDISVSSTGIGVLKTSAILHGVFRPEENKTVWREELDKVSCQVTADTVIMSRMNTPALVGDSAYVASGFDNLFLPDRLWKIVPDKSRITSRFLALALQSPSIRKLLSVTATGASRSMKNLSLNDVLAIQIPLPSLSEQNRIVHEIDCIRTQIQHLQDATHKSLQLLNELKPAIDVSYLSGHVIGGVVDNED